MKRAYRQLAPHEDHLHMSVICIWSVETSCWVFGILHGLAFGLAGAVLQFNRHPPLLVAVARRILAIPVISFFDDFKITELEDALGSGAHYFDKLVALTGWSFDPKKDKTDNPATFLGTVEDFRKAPSTGIITVSPKSLRLQGAIRRIDEALKNEKLSREDAVTLLGKLLSMANCLRGRAARGQLFGLKERTLQKSLDCSISKHLRENLKFHRLLLKLEMWREIELFPTARREVLLYSDASCEPSNGGLPIVQVCWLIFDGPRRLGGVVRVPDRVLRSFGKRKQYIAQGEALAPLLALHYHGNAIRDTSATFFIDNMGVLSGLTVGSSTVADLGTVLHGATLHATKLNIQMWWEHVDSAANPSDGGNRFPFALLAGACEWGGYWPPSFNLLPPPPLLLPPP